MGRGGEGRGGEEGRGEGRGGEGREGRGGEGRGQKGGREAHFVFLALLSHIHNLSYPHTLTFLTLYLHMQLLTPSQPITEDDSERLSVCLRVLSERTDLMGVVFGERSREVLASMLTLREQEQKKEKKVSFVHLFNPGIKPPSILFICVGWS